MELQQSSLYKHYIKRLGWTVSSIDGVSIFIKRIPFIGTIAKIQRPTSLPYIPKLVPLLKKQRVQKIIVEPTGDTDEQQFHQYIQSLSKFFTISKESYLPTKTIIVDLKKPNKKIFQRLSEAKRRGVRRARKNGVVVRESNDIHDLLQIKNTSAGMFGGITTYGIDKLWDIFYPKNATILLAYFTPERSQHSRNWGIFNSGNENPALVGGILLLFWDKTAYYWIAGASKKGKKLFAPTLLVSEALLVSKKRGNDRFDFVGVWDERTPKQFTSWKGFTKFKEGFGGTSVYYPIHNT